MTRLSLALFVFDETVDTNELLSGLSAAEQDRYVALAHDRRRREYLASRWLLRHHLAHECNVAPQALSIEYPAGAAPRCSQAPCHLGLSHSGAACLSLIAEGPAGCDIERIHARRFSPARLAQHCFHADEVTELNRASPSTQVSDFHRLWTLKEATLKAQGLSLAAGMKQPGFRLRPALACTRALSASPWFFAATELERSDDRFAMAIATMRASATIDLVGLRSAGGDGAKRTPLVVDWVTAAYAP